MAPVFAPIVTAAPTLAPVAGSAVASGAAGIGSIFAGLLKHPLWGSLFANAGSGIIDKFLGTQLPYGDFAQEQLQAISGMLPELQAAARGEPTAASKAIREQVSSEGNRAQQAYATGARRAGTVGGIPGGTAPYRAQQGRVQAAVQQGQIQRLGQHQDAAQATLAGLGPTAFQHAGIQEVTNMERTDDMLGALGRFNQKYAENKFDPQFQEMLGFLKQYLFEATGKTQ